MDIQIKLSLAADCSSCGKQAGDALCAPCNDTLKAVIEGAELYFPPHGAVVVEGVGA